MSDNNFSDSSNTFDELYKQMCNSYLEGNDTSINIVDNIVNDVLEATSSSNICKVRKKREYTERDREEGHYRIWNDYFSSNPVYSDEQFRRRFRMRRDLFLRIQRALEQRYSYFQQRVDATGRNSLSPIQKCTAAIRMLAYGVAGDAVDDYVRISSVTALECLKKFCKGVIEIFEPQYLRRPSPEDVQHLLRIGEARGFPGMLGSIDCMHWEWDKCPTAWQGQYTRGDQGVPTMILEAVASYDLWIWHAFFGIAGSNNDINVLDRSPIFDEFLEGRGPEIHYTVNGTTYNMGYYLADGIYPEWPVFVKTIPRANMLSNKRKLFAQYQEGARKDIERAFGVLKKRFAIVCNPARLWKKSELGDIMKACIILHNMIIDDERYENEEGDVQYDVAERNPVQSPQLRHGLIRTYYANRDRYFENNIRIRNRYQCHQLQHDLMEHIWQRFGPNNDNNHR